MAYNTSQINNAANSVKSTYNSVNQYANRAFSALDKYYQGAAVAKNAAYEQYKKALAAQEKQNSDVLNYQKNNAYNAFNQSKKSAFSDYMIATNKTGSFGSKIADSGLRSSGYEQTVKALSFSDYQKNLEQAQTNLTSAIKQYDNQYINSLIQGDTEKAKLSLQMAQEGAELERELTQMLSSLTESIMNMDYNEKSLSAQNSSAASANSIALKNIELQREYNKIAQQIRDYNANKSKQEALGN